MFDAFLRNSFIFSLTKAARLERKALKVVHDFTNSVIVARRNDLLAKREAEDSATSSDTVDLGMKKKQALLDILLQSTIDGQPLTNRDIQEEVDTFVFEGHDTTSSAMCFALYCIARHPEVQEKLLKEIHEVIGEDKEAPLTLAVLNDLHYLDIVLKEVLRLYPSVPLQGRFIEKDTVISKSTKDGFVSSFSTYLPLSDDIKFPSGTNMILSCFAMHRDPEVFPEPEKFRPERFLEENRGGINNPYCYVPFSAGG